MENLDFYHLSGIINSILVMVSLIGIFTQLNVIWKRKILYKKGLLEGETPTSVLSPNRFFTSFTAFFGVYLYGLTLSHFDHYLVWPRIMAMILILWILFEIMVDRWTQRSILLFSSGITFVFLSFLLGLTSYRNIVFMIGIPHLILLCVGILFVQGVIHQIFLIRKTGRTGHYQKKCTSYSL